MTKRLSRAVKKRKRKARTNWRGLCQAYISIVEIWKQNFSVAKAGECEALAELTCYRLICDWACQRIEKLEAVSSDWEASWLKAAHCCHEWVETALERSKEITKLQKERRILLDTLFEVQAENIMQAEDILRQRDELIKLRGVTGERVSCQR